MKSFFINSLRKNNQYFLVLMIAVSFMFMYRIGVPNDWELNTLGLWDDILHSYDDPGRVYPPWGFILLFPFYLIRLAGVRFFSVMTIAWLVKRQEWPFYTFFLIVFSPYFLFTILLGNFDVLVLVFPLLLWQSAKGARWKWLAQGIALAFLLLKPQAGVLVFLYLLWAQRKEWKTLLAPLGVVALITVPISLIGRPPLLLQWINNLLNPSTINDFYWDVNNVSLTDLVSPFIAIGILFLIGAMIYFYYRKKGLHWQPNEIHLILLMLPMMLSPYASQQGVSASFAFAPTLGLLVAQFVFMAVGLLPKAGWLTQEPVRVLILTILAIVFYSLSPLRKELQENK